MRLQANSSAPSGEEQRPAVSGEAMAWPSSAGSLTWRGIRTAANGSTRSVRRTEPGYDSGRPIRNPDRVPAGPNRSSEISAGGGRWTLPQLQRHVAYDRLLERLYLLDGDWVVKGATALTARELGTRGTLDIDLYREISLGAAEADLRRAAAADIGDWFRFGGTAFVPACGPYFGRSARTRQALHRPSSNRECPGGLGPEIATMGGSCPRFIKTTTAATQSEAVGRTATPQLSA